MIAFSLLWNPSHALPVRALSRATHLCPVQRYQYLSMLELHLPLLELYPSNYQHELVGLEAKL